MTDFPFFSRERLIFGIECGNGWFPVIYKLSADIAKITTDISVVQIKEKFGELRYYYSWPETVTEEQNDAIRALVEAAVEQCSAVCEECGAPAQITDQDRWWVCLCHNHLEERANRFKK